MSKTHNYNGEEARTLLATSLQKITDVVASSYGVNGANTLIYEEPTTPQAINDGFRILKSYNPQDTIEKVAHRILLEAVYPTDSEVGDGTTLTAILAGYLSQQVLLLCNSDFNRVTLRKELAIIREEFLKYVDTVAKYPSTPLEYYKIAYISSRSEEIAHLVSQLFEITGKDGTRQLIRHYKNENSIELLNGVSIEHTYMNANFIPNNVEQTTVFNNVALLYTNRDIVDTSELKKAAETAQEKGYSSLVVIANRFDSIVTNFLIQLWQNSQSSFKIFPAMIGYPGDKQTLYLQDLASVTSGKLVNLKNNDSFFTLDDTWLGKSKTVTISPQSIVFEGQEIDTEATQLRLSQVTQSLESETLSNDSNEFLHERKKLLVGKMGIMRIGKPVSTESWGEYTLAEDAIRAVNSSLSKGYIVGGSMIPTKLAYSLDNLEISEQVKDIVSVAFVAPLKNLSLNSGINITNEKGLGKYTGVVNDMLHNNTPYNFRTLDKSTDPLEDGLIDPAEALRQAIKNSFSLALSLIIENILVKESFEQ